MAISRRPAYMRAYGKFFNFNVKKQVARHIVQRPVTYHHLQTKNYLTMTIGILSPIRFRRYITCPV